jgi:hypothetical protein
VDPVPENLVATGIEPGPLDLKAQTLATRPHRMQKHPDSETMCSLKQWSSTGSMRRHLRVYANTSFGVFKIGKRKCNDED